MDLSEQQYIALCKQRIAAKYQLGNGQSNLKNRELEYLMDLIEEKSGIRLSLSTLKRLYFLR